MKELSIEQKAKRYDEILVKLQEAKEDNNVCDDRYCCVVDDIVPELAESEDEKIRKELLLDIPKVFPHDKAFRYIAYLEKQGERKHQYKSRPRYVGEGELLGKKVAKIEPKYAEIVRTNFKDGDWVVYQNETFQVRSLSNGSRLLQGEKYQTYFIAELCRPWTIQDAKDGDILACDTNIIIYGGYINNYAGRIGDKAILAYCGWNGEKLVINKKKKEGFGGIGYIPATKEQRALLFQKMKENGYEWDAEKKELKGKSYETI